MRRLLIGEDPDFVPSDKQVDDNSRLAMDSAEFAVLAVLFRFVLALPLELIGREEGVFVAVGFVKSTFFQRQRLMKVFAKKWKSFPDSFWTIERPTIISPQSFRFHSLTRILRTHFFFNTLATTRFREVGAR